MNEAKSMNLYYTDGSSDKVYQLQLEEKGAGWVVNFQYGRRGSTLKADTKTSEPVSYDVALAAYDKLLKEKTKKGYTPDQSGSKYQDVAAINESIGERFTGVVPQLLNSVREDKVIEKLIKDKEFIAQEKHDGERRSIIFDGQNIEGANRDGLRVALPIVLEQELKKLAKSCKLDGEIMGDRYVAFDIVELDGQSLKEKGVAARLVALEELLKGSKIEVVKTSKTEEEKRELIERVRARRGEGVVFKKNDAPYVPGRPASGGNQLKWKFVESATVRVTEAHKTKRSVFLECVDETGAVVPLGKCSVPKNYDMPGPGDIVEAEYLYMYRGGSLYQPQYKGPRADKSTPDLLSSFKIKADVTTDEDPEEDIAAENVVAPRKKKVSA